jgi:hypothetical protein
MKMMAVDDRELTSATYNHSMQRFIEAMYCHNLKKLRYNFIVHRDKEIPWPK